VRRRVRHVPAWPRAPDRGAAAFARGGGSDAFPRPPQPPVPSRDRRAPRWRRIGPPMGSSPAASAAGSPNRAPSRGRPHEHPRIPGQAAAARYGAPVSDGRAVLRADEAKSAAGELDGPLWVVKAQIHAGGRGKGKLQGASAGEKGGVRLAKSVEEAAETPTKMLGRTLVTHQTGPAGKQVNRSTSRTAPTSRASSICAPRRPRTSRIAFVARPRAAWTSRRSPPTRPRRSSPSPSIRRPAPGPSTAAASPSRWARGQAGQAVRRPVAGSTGSSSRPTCRACSRSTR
jgi:hypothetical protein